MLEGIVSSSTKINKWLNTKTWDDSQGGGDMSIQGKGAGAIIQGNTVAFHHVKRLGYNIKKSCNVSIGGSRIAEGPRRQIPSPPPPPTSYEAQHTFQFFFASPFEARKGSPLLQDHLLLKVHCNFGSPLF